MAADSLAARRAVREHLEANFDEYLSSVSTYLRQAYPDLQLSNDVSEEIAATVIVRVSHSNPDPDDIEKALCKSADDVVRSRRPRLSQAKLLEEVNGPLRSEFPRSLPSLRLVQSFSRAPSSNAEGETSAGPSIVPGTRLVLANPPVDLGASIGFGGARTTEPEPGFSIGPRAGDEPSPDSRTLGESSHREGSDEADEAILESGTLSEADAVDDSRVEAKHSTVEDAFFAEGDAIPAVHSEEPLVAHLDGETRAFEDEGDGEVAEEGERVVWETVTDGADEEGADGHRTDARAPEDDEFWGDDAHEPPPQPRNSTSAAVRPSRLPAAALDAFDDEDDVPVERRQSSAPDSDAERGTDAVAGSPPAPASHATAAPLARPLTAADAIAKAERALGGVTVNEVQVGGALLAPQKLSSVPPTQESIIPKAAPLLTEVEDERAAKVPRARTRRKATTRAKKASTKGRTARAKNTTKRATAKRAPAPARERQAAAPATSGAFVADDLAVLAMLGFPSNPRRAAMLCVTAVSEELGIEGHVDLTPFVAQVVAALEELRNKLERTTPMPPDAHLQWQRVARQSTLRAFLNVDK
jgi:hypothetical protein